TGEGGGRLRESAPKVWVTSWVTTSPKSAYLCSRNTWETVETIDLWVADRKSVGFRVLIPFHQLQIDEPLSAFERLAAGKPCLFGIDQSRCRPTPHRRIFAGALTVLCRQLTCAQEALLTPQHPEQSTRGGPIRWD